MAITSFFGISIPKPGDWLFEAAEKLREERLFVATPFYLPRRQLSEGVDFPGLKEPLSAWLYEQIKDRVVAEDADHLPGEWVLFDVTQRPDYDDGKQMYPDTSRFKEILATLREQGDIAVSDYYKHVPKGSRFAISAVEIDGSSAAVVRAVADILHLQTEQLGTPLYASFNYIGNLAHPELGQVDTWEWFRDNDVTGRCLQGGDFEEGGLSHVNSYWPDGRDGSIGFRLQISAPVKD